MGVNEGYLGEGGSTEKFTCWGQGKARAAATQTHAAASKPVESAARRVTVTISNAATTTGINPLKSRSLVSFV
jgi:hypothetical protein